MDRVICQKTLADSLNLSQSTVSLALRDNATISKATRERVKKLAEEMGYVPDPMLRSLSQYRQAKRPVNFQSVIPWLHSDIDLNAHGSNSPWGLMLQGAERRCEQTGFRLEPTWLGASHISPERLERKMFERGILGAILSPHGEKSDWLEHLSKFSISIVAVGSNGDRICPLDHVSPDHYQNARKLIGRIEGQGPARVGVCLPHRLDRFILKQYSSVFRRVSLQNRKCDWSVFDYDNQLEPERFSEWFDSFDPEALVFANYSHYLESLRLLSPEMRTRVESMRCNLLCVSVDDHANGCLLSGIDEHLEEVGAAAVDMLSTRFGNRSQNRSMHRRRLLVQGSWMNTEAGN